MTSLAGRRHLNKAGGHDWEAMQPIVADDADGLVIRIKCKRCPALIRLFVPSYDLREHACVR